MTRSAYGFTDGNPLNAIDPSGLIRIAPADPRANCDGTVGQAGSPSSYNRSPDSQARERELELRGRVMQKVGQAMYLLGVSAMPRGAIIGAVDILGSFQ